jgi:hypothetical protein
MNTSEVCRSLFRLYALIICVKIKIQKLSYPYASQLSFLRLVFDIYVKIVFVQSRAINFGRQGHSLTQLKMLHCKTVANIITYHHVV